MGRCLLLGIFFIGLHLTVSADSGNSLPVAAANDNTAPAGQLSNGVLTLHLELRKCAWFPAAADGVHREIYTFAEAGHAVANPGPLIRVPQGTEIHATVHNTLALPAKIYGLHTHPGDANESISLAAGETRELKFLAGDPGTYLYWGTTAGHALENRGDAETTLSGAFVIDPLGAKPNDHIFVINFWQKGDPALPTLEELPALNGREWPYTERLKYKMGETVHWRVINATAIDHAMHLHGFYFLVDGTGDGNRYESFAPDQRIRAVTEHIDPGHVFEMTWTPDRAGNWLFHCHMMQHMSSLPDPSAKPAPQTAAYSMEHDNSMGMSGLVIGITVLPDGSAPRVAETSPTRKLQLVIADNPTKVPFYSLHVIDPMRPAAGDEKDPPSLLGPPIVITRGETTEIEVKNSSSKTTVIHWHGMELESYYDGVAGWTGSDQQKSPAIAPGTSFSARMTPPRAGTFIYHTHWHDGTQLLNGIYGPLIVLEPGEKYDPEHDRTFVFSMGRYEPFGFMMLINGNPEPDLLQLHTSTRYHLRLINITDNAADLRVRITRDDKPVAWQVIAKDGADLPPAQLKSSVADMGITVGETYDVEYESKNPGFEAFTIYEQFYPQPVTVPLYFTDGR